MYSIKKNNLGNKENPGYHPPSEHSSRPPCETPAAQTRHRRGARRRVNAAHGHQPRPSKALGDDSSPGLHAPLARQCQGRQPPAFPWKKPQGISFLQAVWWLPSFQWLTCTVRPSLPGGESPTSRFLYPLCTPRDGLCCLCSRANDPVRSNDLRIPPGC